MNTPWAILLIKFSDDDSEPYPRSRYEEIFTTAGESKWNMVDYFRDMSHGRLDLSGSQVFGWFTLSRKKSDYVGSGANQQGRQDLIDWARQAAVSAGVNLASYYSVVVVLNTDADLFGGPSGVVCGDAGTRAALTGLSPSYLGQEMGHTYGLAHSRRDGSVDDYQDPFDVMSTANAQMSAHPVYTERQRQNGSPVFVIGPGLNAANMDAMGWLDESRIWSGSLGKTTDATVQLRPLHRTDLPGFLAMRFGPYLVEFRMNEAWDAAVPPSVQVHYFEDGHSYIVQDAFGKIQFGDGSTLKWAGELSVLSLDQANRTATVHVRWEGLPDIHREWPKQGPYQTPWIKWAERLDPGVAFVVIEGRSISVRRGSSMYEILKGVALHESPPASMSSHLSRAVRLEAITNIAALTAASINAQFRSPALPRADLRVPRTL
jgi:hypothetical protein